MKCARFTAKGGQLEIADVPIPDVKPGHVRVKVVACGVCHSDNIVKHDLWNISYPRIPGHEVAGFVDEVGEGVTKFKKGDSVGIGWFGGHCGSCRPCLQDDWVCCEKSAGPTGISFDGGYAEYCVAPQDALARMPDKLNKNEAAPLLCAGVTTFNAIRNQGLKPGDVCAVIGVGGLGHLALQYANKFGYHVVAISNGNAKEKLARELGAHTYLDSSNPKNVVAELKKLGGAKLLVQTAPSAKALEDLLPGLAVRGKALVIAAIGEPVKVNAMALLSSNQSVVGWASGDARASEDALNFTTLSGIVPKIQTFKLADAQKAFESMEKNEVRFRAVLTMD